MNWLKRDATCRENGTLTVVANTLCPLPVPGPLVMPCNTLPCT